MVHTTILHTTTKILGKMPKNIFFPQWFIFFSTFFIDVVVMAWYWLLGKLNFNEERL